MVMVEFVFVVGPLLVFILGIIQMIVLQAAELSTVRAANAATRAAIVVLDDDPQYYGGEPRGQAPPGSQRYREIQRAAAQVLVSAQPPNRTPKNGSLFEAIMTPDRNEDLPGLLEAPDFLIERVRVDVTGGDSLDGPVTVRVEFDYPCMVPLGRLLLCRDGERELHSESTLPNQGASYDY